MQVKTKNILWQRLGALERQARPLKQSEEMAVDKLKKDVGELVEVTIWLADEPSDRLKEMIDQWLVEKLGKELVVQFKIENRLVGGAVIEYNGKRFDYSLKSRL